MPCSSPTRQAGESVSRWVRRTWLARSFSTSCMRASRSLNSPSLSSSATFAEVSPSLLTSRSPCAADCSFLPSNSVRCDTTHSSTRSVSSSTSTPFFRNTSRCGLLLGGREAVGGHVVDGVLPRLHPADVVGERDGLFRAVGVRRRKAKQLRDPLAVRRVLDDAFLEHAAELGPEGRVLLFLLLGQILEQTPAPASRTPRESAPRRTTAAGSRATR